MSQGLSGRIVLYLVAVLVTAAFAVVSITVMTSGDAGAVNYCNSGSGNDSEGTPIDCDPGGSAGHNQGGD